MQSYFCFGYLYSVLQNHNLSNCILLQMIKNTIFKCDMLALALLRIEIFLPSLCFQTKSSQKPKSWQTINSFYIKIIFVFLPKNSSRKYPPKTSSQKKSYKKNPTKIQKIPPKISKIQKNSKKIPKKFSKNFKDFENIQFSTSHLRVVIFSLFDMVV